MVSLENSLFKKVHYFERYYCTLTRCACSKCQIPAANIIDAISSSTLFATVFSSSSIKFDHLNLNEIITSCHFLIITFHFVMYALAG